MSYLLQDLHYALRTFAKSPVFVMVAVFSLALGIGANTAIFTLVNQVLLQRLPVLNPEELVLLKAMGRHYGSNNGRDKLSYPMYTDFRDRNDVFQGMFCRDQKAFNISVEGRTERVSGELVSGNYFPVLGIRAVLGRVFTAQDDLMQGANPSAVLSYGFWQSRFAGSRDVIGKKLVLNGYPFTIIGVSESGFNSTDPLLAPQIRIPVSMKAQVDKQAFYSLNDRRGRWVNVYGRMKPGVTVAQVKAALQPQFHQILEGEVRAKEFAKAAPESKAEFLKMYLDILPASQGRSNMRDRFQKPLLVLTAVVGLVLLIACANVANLLVARATARQKEIAIRLALGASRGRLISQLLTESLLLALVGGVAGLLLAIGIDRVLLSFLPDEGTPLALSGLPDGRVLLFAAAVSLVTGVLFGLAPALQSTRPNLSGTLKDQAGAVVGGTAISLRKALVVAQVALSLLLLIGAGLFIRSLRNLHDLDPGFRVQNLIAFSINAPLNGYTPERSLQEYRQIKEVMDRLPGVTANAMAIMPILEGDEWDNTMTVDTFNAKPGESPDPHMNFLSADYFRALDTPLLLGRDFNVRDAKAAPKVAIVNETFAKRYLGSATNAMGHKIGSGGDPGTKTDITIVGVARDTKYEGMRDRVPDEVYLPFQQQPFVLGVNCYVRTASDPAQMFASLRKVVHETDPNLPVTDMKTMEKQLDNSLVTERLVASLSSAFGLLATVLAGIGLYGVMAYLVARRTREIGIRMALGAMPGNVLWLIMREVLVLVGLGVVIAVPSALGLTRLVSAQLYGITPNDPLSIVAATLGIAGVAILAGYLPARRATRIDPMNALRYE